MPLRQALTFQDTHKLLANRETLTLTHVAPAHTGDYRCGENTVPDRLSQQAALCAAPVGRSQAAPAGPVRRPQPAQLAPDRDAVKFRDMLVTARDRIEKLKSSGKSAQEAVAAKPFADLEPNWGKGFFNGDVFVQILYVTPQLRMAPATRAPSTVSLCT